MKLSELDFLRLLPVFMRDDEANIAISNAINKLMGNLRLDTLSTWASIDQLTEEELDELAWELDIDWYEKTMSIEEKRETVKIAPYIKSKRGTKWAVERVISLYLGEGGVVEWCEKEPPGPPYTFEVYTSNEEVTEELLAQFATAANIAKNKRSHMIGMSHRYLLNDIATGVKYYLFVESGHLKMSQSEATADAKNIFLLDATTDKTYFLYVENGHLKMDETAETIGRENLPFRDFSTDTAHKVYVSGGNLMIDIA